MKSRNNPPVCPSWIREGSRALQTRRSISAPRASEAFFLFLFLAFAIPTFAAEVDVSQLPPVAKITVDFDRDVRPILEESCIRCHGPERPKSGFRLDNRE